MGAVTDGGGLAGILVAFVLMLAAGLAGFVPLAAVFLLTAVDHPLGLRAQADAWVWRSADGAAPPRRSSPTCVRRRSAPLPVIWFPRFRDVLLLAAMAALAEAAADTVSSEVGQATANSAYMITGLSVRGDRNQRRHQRRGHLERLHRCLHCGLGQRLLRACAVAVDAAGCRCRGGGHVFRQSSGRDMGERRKDGQRFGELCEYGARCRLGARRGDGGGEVRVLSGAGGDASCALARMARQQVVSGSGFTMEVTAASAGRTCIRTYNVCIVGFGNVGQALVALLQRKEQELRELYGIAWRVTGVASRRLGWLVAPTGFAAGKLLAGDFAGAQPA